MDSTFTFTFYFPHKTMKNKSVIKIYRNPIYLAKDYRKIIDSGEVKNQSDLAKLKGISRARVTQILNLSKLNKEIVDNLEQIGNPMDKKLISERKFPKINH